MIISVGKKRKEKKPQIVNLIKHIEPAKESYFSYINENNKEIEYKGYYNKRKIGYSFIYEQIDEYNINEDFNNTYIDIDPHFSYIDKDGYKRVFNKLETLKFNEELNTYMGDIEIVNYIDEKIQIFEEE